MESLPCNDAPRNLCVAGQALEGGLSGRDLMTIRAIGDAINRLVGAGKRARRDLPSSRN